MEGQDVRLERDEVASFLAFFIFLPVLKVSSASLLLIAFSAL